MNSNERSEVAFVICRVSMIQSDSKIMRGQYFVTNVILLTVQYVIYSHASKPVPLIPGPT